MKKDKIFLILMLSLIFMCYLGAVSASEISDDTLSVDADVDSISESSDEVLEVNDNEKEVLSGNPVTASNWGQLYSACDATTDQEITLTDNITIGTNDISFKNNAVIKGNSKYITGDATGRIPFQCGNLALDITFENIIFKDISSDMVIKMQNSGVTTLKDCTFINANGANDGKNSTVYNNNGIMNIENCTFRNCNASFGPITNHRDGTVTGVTLNVYNSTFENNHGNAPGVINNCGVMTVYNSVFNNNSANQWGGAIHTHTRATSTIRNSAFNGNYAGWNGGALYGYGTINVYDSNFTNNNCSANNGGGAIGASNYFFYQYTVVVNNCRFVDNNNLCYLYDNVSTETLGRGGAISVLNGGWLTVLDSKFIHNGAKIGQAICGYNTNYYSNISSGNYILYIENNEFINHNITTNDTVYYVGGCTLIDNTFTNSIQTLDIDNNIIQSSNNDDNLILRVSKEDVLCISENDVLTDNPVTLYVNASSGKTACSMPGMINENANALSWETAPSKGFRRESDLFQMIIQCYDQQGYDVFNIMIADGVYSGMPSMGKNINYIGYGDNVIFKLNDLSYGSMIGTYKITFTNIIFLDETITFDDFEFEFTNCTFKNCTIEFAKVKSSKTYSEDTNVKICTAILSNCKFVNSSANQIINAHKYEIVNIDNCTFDNVASDAVILVTSNYTDVNDVKDGVTINKLNVINSTVKGIIKVEKDSLSRLSNDNVNYDFETVQDDLVDGDYTYLIVPVNKTSLTVKVADIKEGEAFTIDVALSNNLTVNVSVVINKKEYNVSVVNGTGSLKVSDKLAANTYDVEASYAGEYPYAASTNTTTFKVEKVSTPASDKDKQTTPKVTKKATKITAKKATFKAKKKTKKYTIVLKAGKAAVKKVKVTLKVGKKTYKATTNSKGKATFKITKLNKKGKYNAVIKFAGNKNFKATSKKVKITVKK